jgi:hypothetical protein
MLLIFVHLVLICCTLGKLIMLCCRLDSEEEEKGEEETGRLNMKLMCVLIVA